MTRLDISAIQELRRLSEQGHQEQAAHRIQAKFKAAEQASPIELEVASHRGRRHRRNLCPLFTGLRESGLQFEKLTKAYFIELGRRMPDKARFFIWRQDGKIIAFSLCLLQGDALYGEYLGLDYEIALELHLYFYVMRDIISWAIGNGFKSIVSTSLGYAPKLQMRHALLNRSTFTSGIPRRLSTWRSAVPALAGADARRADLEAVPELRRALGRSNARSEFTRV